MPKRVTSATDRKWQRYNRWRALNRAVDRERRLARIAARRAEFVAGYVVPPAKPPPMPKPAAVVRVTFADGHSASFRIRRTPHGLTCSATTAGRRVAELLKAALGTPRSH